MKITQITPGLISIPPNGWGAIEKVIWNYKLQFEEMGHVCDIKYLNDVDVNNTDIIHLHVANLGIEAQKRGIPYIFSLHDHHVVRHGKDSHTYKQNLEAIKGSIVSFTHAEFLVDYFEETDKLFYLTHGVDTKFFDLPYKEDFKHKLLCIANNGYADDQTIDRKGFRYAIEAAKELNMDITIVGPPNNMNFFNANPDLLEYGKLNIISHNPSEEELLKIIEEHSIFLHPSELEAGHPNLTLLESISCRVPVVGTYDGNHKIEGLYKVERSTESVKKGILEVIENYAHYMINTEIDRKYYDWSTVCTRLLNMYGDVLKIQKEYTSDITKNLFIRAFNETKDVKPMLNEKLAINVHFVDGPTVDVQSNLDDEYTVDFFEDDNTLTYTSKIRSNMWTKSNKKFHKDWRIRVSNSSGTILNRKFPFEGMRVYIAIDSGSLGDSIAWVPYVDEFRKKHKCHVICSTFKNFLFEQSYPEIEFVTPGTEVKNIYAMYKLGWFYNRDLEPTLPNTIPLQQTASNILGLEFKEIKTNIDFIPKEKPYPENYICIATNSTAGCKYWNNPTGWVDLIRHFKSLGYKVINISQNGDKYEGADSLEDDSIDNTMNVIYHSQFVVGLSSGLSWLSWALGKHVVMISNFTEPDHEFTSNCTRIINRSVCNGCWNNPMFLFNKGDWNWCPEHKDTERQFECHKSITADMVISQIQNLL